MGRFSGSQNAIFDRFFPRAISLEGFKCPVIFSDKVQLNLTIQNKYGFLSSLS